MKNHSMLLKIPRSSIRLDRLLEQRQNERMLIRFKRCPSDKQMNKLVKYDRFLKKDQTMTNLHQRSSIYSTVEEQKRTHNI